MRQEPALQQEIIFDNRGALSQDFRLFLISFLTLYFEIMIIRWLSVEVRIFAYFKNLVLIASFLGMGMGCAFIRKKASLIQTYLLMLCLILLAKVTVAGFSAQNLSAVLSSFEDSHLWGEASFLNETQFTVFKFQLGAILFLMLFFILNVMIFFPMGCLIGRLLSGYANPLRAYSINIVGSLLGIWAFSALSFVPLSPPYWFGIGLLLLLFVGGEGRKAFVICAIAGALTCFAAMDRSGPTRRVIWSPYQKLIIEPKFFVSNGQPIRTGFSMEVNHTFYQNMLDLSDQFKKAHPALFPPEALQYDHYDVAYRFAERADDVLIVGAGSGNDAAGALRNGARHIDAIEIDPSIIMAGKALHPEQPYQSDSVNVVVDDARAYFKRSNKVYDLIVFGLLDSHTLTSSFTNVRLDNYVYTVESLREARRHLKPGGLVVLIFEVQREWLGRRIYSMLEEAFGHPPLCFLDRPGQVRGTGGVVFVNAAQDVLQQSMGRDPNLRAFVEKNKLTYAGNPPLTVDDWPYLYLKDRRIPKLYWVITTGLLIISIFSIFLVKSRLPTIRQVDGHFFFLGAAFLLLEVESISKIALLFGTTWLVNSVIISAILLMILAANFYVAKAPSRPIKVYYGALIVSLLPSYFLPLDALLTGNFALAAIAASIILTMPLFFAGIIFANSFQQSHDLENAFGSNLMGAMVGGLLECTSFLWGLRALIIIGGVLYILSFLFYRSRPRLPA